MSERAKKASAALVVMVVLLGVAMWLMVTIQRGLEQAVVVRDVAMTGDFIERRLLSDDIIQASQFLKPAKEEDWGKSLRDRSRLPSAYWHPRGPVGSALAPFAWFGKDNAGRGDARLPASLLGHGPPLLAPLPLGQLVTVWSEPPIGIVQMKAGAPAAYGRPFQIIDFYESNPQIIALSRPSEGEPAFTYLRDAERRGSSVRVFEGPELESLAQRGPRSFYRVLLVETTRRGDTVADELITQDALRLYLQALAGAGVLGVHVSSRDGGFRLKTAEVLHDAGLAVKLGADPGDPSRGHYPADWLMAARRPAQLMHLQNAGPAAALQWSVLEVTRTAAPQR
jgi:hypothetical protein